MDAARFDTLVRSLALTGSRRRALAALSGVLGLALGQSLPAGVEAKKKKCPPCKKRKKGKCKKKLPDGTACPGGTCQGGSCVAPPPPGCGTGPACGAGQICAQGQCVTGQGTCASGADACIGSAPCGPASSNCLCFTTTANQTRCGINDPLTLCDTCVSDASCAALFPTTPGVFCLQDLGGNCACGGRCMAPCCQGQADGTNCGPGRTCQGGICVGGGTSGSSGSSGVSGGTSGGTSGGPTSGSSGASGSSEALRTFDTVRTFSTSPWHATEAAPSARVAGGLNMSLGLSHLLAPVLAAGSVFAAWRSRTRLSSTGTMRSSTPQQSAGEENAD